MYYFQYYQGVFRVIREFNDAYNEEIADIIPFYDLKKIVNWCNCAYMKFPYEFNDIVCNIISNILLDYDDWDNIEKCLSSFHKNVINGDIKLYCEEKK